MSDLYFIRHAHTVLNGKMLFQGGQTDSELDDIGIKQLRNSSHELINILPKNYLLVSSPLLRIRQTVDGLGLNKENLIYDKRLKEIDFGQWEGRSLSYIKKKFPDDVEKYYNNDPFISPANGESINSVANRVVKAIYHYAYGDFENVVFVSHGNAISIGLSSLLLGRSEFKRILSIPDNVSVSKVTIKDSVSLKYYNHKLY